jgi:Domain of unknown function (DUF4296)
MILLKLPPSVPIKLGLPYGSIFYLFLSFFTFNACENNTSQLPMPKDKVVELLADIHMADAYVESVNPTMKDSMAKLYYPQIFKHHGITTTVYDSTFAVLSKHPDLMKNVYDAVLLKIEERQKIMRGDTLQKDSIKMAPNNATQKN